MQTLLAWLQPKWYVIVEQLIFLIQVVCVCVCLQEELDANNRQTQVQLQDVTMGTCKSCTWRSLKKKLSFQWTRFHLLMCSAGHSQALVELQALRLRSKEQSAQMANQVGCFLTGWKFGWLCRGWVHYFCNWRITRIPSVLSQRAQISELKRDKEALAADLQRTELEVCKQEAETLKSIAALKAIKEARAFSSNQQVQLTCVFVGASDRDGVCVLTNRTARSIDYATKRLNWSGTCRTLKLSVERWTQPLRNSLVRRPRSKSKGIKQHSFMRRK